MNAVDRVFYIICTVVFLVSSIFCMITLSQTFSIMMLVCLMVSIVTAFYFVIQYRRNIIETELSFDKNKIKFEKLIHVSGLPVPKGETVILIYNMDDMKIIMKEREFSLKADCIHECIYKKEREIKWTTNLKSITLGSICQEKIDKKDYKTNYIFIINYEKHNRDEYLIFRTTCFNWKINEFCKFFKQIFKGSEKKVGVSL